MRCLPLVLLTLVPALTATAANLVQNSDFEDAVSAGTIPEAWSAPGSPPGGSVGLDQTHTRSGRFAARFVVPDQAPLDWYQLRYTLPTVASGRTLTLSAWVFTENVHDGSGAYCSLNCFDGAGKRLAYFDAPGPVSGSSTQWRRQTVTATIPPRTTEAVVILTLYGHGQAWFDDIQVEEGTAATEYAPSPVDQETTRQKAVQRQEALAFAQALPAAGSGPRVAVLRDELPAGPGAAGPERLGGWLSGAGYRVTYLTATQLANPFILRGPLVAADAGLPVFDLLVLPYGAAFPAPAARSLKSYLRQQGAFLSTGGYAFDELLVPYQAKWYRPADLPPAAGASAPVLGFEPPADEPATAGWSLGCDPEGVKPALRLVPGPAGRGQGLEFAVTPLRIWSTATLDVAGRLPVDGLVAGKPWSVTRLWAKGDARTPRVALEWDEGDGSRWKATIELSTEWKEYVLHRDDFTYWHDNPSVGRGGAEDHLHPERAKCFQIGMALDIAERDQPHVVQLDDLRVQVDELAPLRAQPQCLNTRVAKIRDAMWPTPDQVPVFDPSRDLEFVATARAAAGQHVAGPAKWAGPFEGWAAVGMTSNQGHGFGPNLCRLVPLLEGLDRFGRPRGALGSLMYPYDGYYRGAAFGFFGVTNRDLFAEGQPGARDLLLSTAAALVRRVYLHDTEAEFSSYRPGETIGLRTRASNFGRQDRPVAVTLEAFAGRPAEGGKRVFRETKEGTLAAGATAQFDFPFTPAEQADFYTFAATVAVDGKPVDTEQNAVVVWRERPEATMPPVAAPGPYFTFTPAAGAPRPLFLLGCQTYWGQNGSVTARSPLAFERDYSLMQDYGLHFTRLFVPFRTDSERRQSDAMVQLAARHRVLFYHAPNLGNTADPQELEKQAQLSKELGERYRNQPWLLVDVCNEPSLHVESEGLAEPFRQYLRSEYGSDEALRKAWGTAAVSLGEVKPEPLSERFEDLRSYDTHRFLALVQQHWADNSREGARAADPARLVSVGLMQGFGSGEQVWDPPLTHANLDFTDRHYYGPPTGQATQLKDIDQRLLGKPLVQGECGAVDHPTYAAAAVWNGVTRPEHTRRFQSLVHHGFGLGAAVVCTWHLRNPMEGIFPCGQVHADGVPRHSATVMRALALTFGRLRPAYRTPPVALLLPETHRLGGSRNRVNNAIHRAEEMLFGCHVDYGVISEAQLDRLPAEVKLLVYPVPYCPSDEVVGKLAAFVQRGGCLYFSGDLSYDETRQLTRAERLVKLAGVERVSGQYPGADLQPLTVRPLTAASLPLPNGAPLTTTNRVGQGQVIFCTAPWEMGGEAPPWQRALYLRVLELAGVRRNPVTPDVPSLECFRVALEQGGEAYVLFNNDTRPVAAELSLTTGKIGVRVAPGAPGLVVVDKQGRLLAVEGQGAVTRGGKQLAVLEGQAIIESLDGADLAQSRSLLVLPMPLYGTRQASVTLPALAKLKLELGDLHQTKWRTLEPLRADREGRLRYDREQALNMVLAGDATTLPQAKARLAQFTTDPVAAR